MRGIAIVSLLAVGASALAQSSPDARNAVNVYVLEYVSDRGLNLLRAKSIVSHIFAESGVRIKWQLGVPKHREQHMPIIIDLRSNAPKMLAPDVLACAQVYEGVHISVFWDRVKATVRGANPLATFLLAHVTAHEITHVLEGIDRHSKTGLMKASWTQMEIEEMTVHPLSLAAEDVQLIRQALRKD